MNRNWAIAFIIAGVAVAAWYYYHKSCPVCQERWKQIKNRLGSAMMEPKPEDKQ